jgi:anaerobic magnesium-protoporphyrin IX monomethyl ester cyclase
MLKTTFVYPGIAGMGFRSLLKGMDGAWISHGLASLSATITQAGFQSDLIDLRGIHNWEEFQRELARRNPDVVALTMMSVDVNPVREACRLIKAHRPQILTVVGGPHVSLATEDAIRIPHIDYWVRREGEITLLRLLRDIAVGTRPVERILEGEQPDLDQLPFADRFLFLKEWRRCGYKLDSPEVPFVPDLPAPFATLIAGRGCAYHCTFCKPGEDLLFGYPPRRRSVESILAELRLLSETHHIASFMFHDDCLTEDRAWLQAFCRRYKEEGFNQAFYMQSRSDLIVRNKDLLAELVKVGLRGCFIGFESGSQRVLDFLRKGTKVAHNLEAAKICKQLKIRIWANYMIGIPTETKEEIRETVAMLKKIDPDFFSPAFYTPHPGTALFDYVQEQELSLINNYDSYRRNPTEPKIKGFDQAYLLWALGESQKRPFWRTLSRWLKEQQRRFRPA